MTTNVTGAWASNALWPDSSTTRKSNTDYDALARRAAADDAKTSVATGQVVANTKATPSGFTQDDFALATRFGQSFVPQSLQQLTGLQKIEREPWHGADRAASNPYGNIMDSLRRAALRRDAAAAAVPSPDETASTAERAAAESTAGTTTSASVAISTAIAAYTAAAQTGDPTPSDPTPAADPSPTADPAPTGGTTSSGGSTPTHSADWWLKFFQHH